MPKKTQTENDNAASLLSEAAQMANTEAVLEAAVAANQRLLEEDAKGTHAPTRPWTREGKMRYQRKLLDTTGSRAGFRKRWTRIDMIEQRLAQGYRLANPSDYGELIRKEVGEEGQTQPGVIRRREMVLMEIPEEMSNEIRAHYAEQRRRMTQAAQAPVDEASAQTGATLYDPRDGTTR
jgi:hypothetical protein